MLHLWGLWTCVGAVSMCWRSIHLGIAQCSKLTCLQMSLMWIMMGTLIMHRAIAIMHMYTEASVDEQKEAQVEHIADNEGTQGFSASWCEFDIMVGNKEKLCSTHKGIIRLENIAFSDMLFAPGLLQTLISEPQLEKKGCKIVSEHGIHMVSKGGKYMFHGTPEHNSYAFRPNWLPTSSRVLQSEEVALAASVVPDTSAGLWYLRLGHLNYGDMCKLRGRYTG